MRPWKLNKRIFHVPDNFYSNCTMQTDHWFLNDWTSSDKSSREVFSLAVKGHGFITTSIQPYIQTRHNYSKQFKSVRCEDKKSILFDKLTSAGFQEAIDNALASIGTDINSAVSILTNALLESASCMKKNMNYNSTGNFKAKWFDEECFQLKREVKRTLRRYRRKRKIMWLTKLFENTQRLQKQTQNKEA